MTKSGIVALVGSGEFLPPISPTDRNLIARLGERGRVAIVPTASAPDGTKTFDRWLNLGVEHFKSLDCDVEAVRLATRADAEDEAITAALDRCNFVYLSGGKPRFLYDTLQGTSAWDAIARVHQRGGIIAGCSAGAMVLGSRMVNFPSTHLTVPGFGLAPRILVIPHFDEFRFGREAIPLLRSKDFAIAGIDGSTALVVADQRWEVVGKGSVTIFDAEGHRQYLAGATIERP